MHGSDLNESRALVVLPLQVLAELLLLIGLDDEKIGLSEEKVLGVGFSLSDGYLPKMVNLLLLVF